ncbi:helix-turn-helix domain-containing protein [Mycetohabitans rhizoxinica]
MAEAKADVIRQALQRHDGNMSATARPKPGHLARDAAPKTTRS